MSLEEVRTCILLLDSDKSIERKKAADLLKSLLNNDNIVSTLNTLSTKKRSSLSWERVFDSSRHFLAKEAKKIEKDERSKENPSVNVRNNWENQKRNATALLKLILRKSVHILGSPFIGISSLLELIFYILDRKDNPYILENFAGDALEIVQKYILGYPQYYLHVPQGKWKDLMRFCIWIYENNVGKADPLTCISVMEGIIKSFKLSRSSSSQFLSPSVAFRALPPFLSRSLNSSKVSKNYGIEAAYLSLLYTTCLEFGSQWRSCLVSIGEETMPIILRMWEFRPTQRQIILLQYLNLQLVMHSPQKDGEIVVNCQLCHNQCVWQKCLFQLYALIDEYIKDFDQDLRKTISCRINDNESIPEELVALASRLISQVFNFSNGATSQDITQVNADEGSTQHFLVSQAAKKRKIEIGWEVILSFLKEEAMAKVRISWLNIFSHMMQHHKFFFTSLRASQLFDLLLHLLCTSKDSSVTDKILLCLNNLSIISGMQPLLNGTDISKDKWSKVSDHALRLIAGKQCSDTGINLLTTLICNGTVHSSIVVTIYSLLCRKVLCINKEVLNLLEIMLLTFPLPKFISNDDYLQRTHGDLDVKKSLLKLLLPLTDDFDSVYEIRNNHELCVHYPEKLSSILNLLALQCPLKYIKIQDSVWKEESKKSPELKMEEIFLKYTFCHIEKSNSESEKCDSASISGQFNSDSQEHIINRFISFVNENASSKRANVAKEELDIFINSLKLSNYLITYFRDERLQSVYKHLSQLPSIVENAIPSSDSLSWNEFQALLTNINSIFEKAIEIVKSDTSMEKILINLLNNFPQAVQDKLINFISARVKRSATCSSSQFSNLSPIQNNNSTTQSKSSDNLFDADFDDVDASKELEILDTPFQDFENEKNLSNRIITHGAQISISTNCLSTKDNCILLSAKMLGLIFELSSECNYGIDDDNSPFVKVIDHIIELGKSDDIEDLSLVLLFVKFLFGSKYHSENISEGIDMLYQISGKFVEDPRIVSAIINCLKDLIHANGDHLVNMQKVNVIHLLKAYATKLKEGIYGSHVAISFIEVILQLAQIDPLRTWSHFTVPLDDRISEVYYFLRHPYFDIRLKVAECLPFIFSYNGDSTRPMSMEHQTNLFQKVYQVAIESLTVEGTVGAELIADEESCSIAAFLSSMLMIAHASPYLEPMVLFAILSLYKTRKADIGVIQDAINQLAQASQLNVLEFLKEHLFYLLTQWFKEKYSLEEFPFAVFDCHQELLSFINEYSDVIVSAYFHQDQQELISEMVSEKIGVELNILIEQNFAWLIASIMPFLVASRKENDERFQVSKFKIYSSTKKWKFLEGILGESKLASLMEKSVCNIVLTILQMSYDSQQWVENEAMIQPPVLHFESHFVVATLSEAHKIFYKDKSSIIRCLAEEKISLYSIIQSLSDGIARNAAPHKLRWALEKIETFLEVLLPCLGSELLSLNVFVIRKLTTVLSHFTIQLATSKLPILANKCTALLHNTVNSSIALDCDYLVSSIPFLVSRLLELRTNKDVWSSTVLVLNTIFNCEDMKMKSAIAGLPVISCDSDISYLDTLNQKHLYIIKQIRGSICLRNIVEDLLKLPANDVTTFNLKYLSNMLSERHFEISELYSSMNLDGEKLAHSLIHRIVTIINLTSDKGKALAAVDCLGKLGPIYLGKAVFDLVDSEETYDSPENGHNFGFPQILRHLTRLVYSTDMKLADVACNALAHILKTKLGFKIFKSLNDSNLERHLAPFLPDTTPKGSARQSTDMELTAVKFLLEGNDVTDINVSFEAWIKNFTVNLLRSGCGCDFYYFITPVCKINANFCKQVVPFVFHAMLIANTDQHRIILSSMVNTLVVALTDELSKVNDIKSNSFSEDSSHNMCRRVLRIIINIVNHLRNKDPNICFSGRAKYSEWERNFWLDLDYLQLAKAAHICGSHFSAILFAEMACNVLEDQLTTKRKISDLSFASIDILRCQLPPLQRVSDSARGEEISSLLLQVYNALEESDGVEGCSGTSFSTNCVVQSTLNMHRGNWMQALAISDAGRIFHGLMDGLRFTGMFNTLDAISQMNHHSVDPKLTEARAECCWRLGKWEEVVNIEAPHAFHQSFFNTLLEMRKRDVESIESIKGKFHLRMMSFLKENGNESTASIYPILAHLQIFSEINEISKLLLCTTEEFTSYMIQLNTSWEERNNFGAVEPKLKELILSSRVVTLNCMLQLLEHQGKPLQSLLFKCLMQKCELARSLKIEGLSYYEAAILEAKKLHLSNEDSWLLTAEEVHLALCLNNPAQALRTLDQLMNVIKPKLHNGEMIPVKEYFKAKFQYGEILLKSRTCSPISVIDNYFMTAIQDIQHCGEHNCVALLEDSYYKLAELGHSLYEEVNNSMSSEYYEERIRQLERSKLEKERADSIRKHSGHSEAEVTALKRKLYEISCDIVREEDEILKLKKDVENFLSLTLKNYFKSIAHSSHHNLSMFRIIALWFENLTSAEANELVANYSQNVKSHLFIPLIYQLVARLCSSKKSIKHDPMFPSVLCSILERVCKEHPHHSLPSLLMLAHAHLDEDLLRNVSFINRNTIKKSKICEQTLIEEERVQAAKLLVQRLKKSSLVDHINELERVCVAYISLSLEMDGADYKRKKSGDNVKVQLNRNFQLMKLKNLAYTAPLTRPMKIQPSGAYSPPLIMGWESTGIFVGGVNAPIKLCVIASDGLKTNELLKGNDDLRQDAVLEQVFCVVNELLFKDNEAKKKKLNMRTYTVIPLSQKFGVLQWCDNTATFESLLKIEHAKYYPDEENLDKMRNRLKDASKKPANELIKTFENILGSFHPVFRHFFYENYPKPELWFNQRQAYTRAVATSSISGYILGLGDRHGKNLLLDIKTAEIIHIDLGIAFDKGAILPTPERVPFRMTQNIVDGLGVFGIEGPLRKGMETTLRVLREARSVLVTIVEVLKHDPLHQWTLSPKQIAKLRKQDSSSQNLECNQESNSASLAERALVRVQQKLNGLQNGRVLSVPEHVSFLLQESTSISNLALMYNGWQPYL